MFAGKPSMPGSTEVHSETNDRKLGIYEQHDLGKKMSPKLQGKNIKDLPPFN
ncbi:hypothetical protein NC652_014462 [Populus alba x Populus x berolinensis]|nr:hypothetical protein NC652_014462 [Populus alba x Populus x berolinensis]